MSQIEFLYEGSITIIQCNINEKMKDIFKRFTIKQGIEENRKKKELEEIQNNLEKMKDIYKQKLPEEPSDDDPNKTIILFIR